MNLKVLPPLDTSDFTRICAVGQAYVVGPDAEFSADEDCMSIPIMIQCEFYPEISTDEFRFSVRSNDKVKIVACFAQLVKLFV
jgi:hypothetical protein